MVGGAVLQPWTEEADQITSDRTIPALLVGVAGLLLLHEVSPDRVHLRRVPLAIRERCPGPPDRLLGQPARGEPRDDGSSTQEEATAEEHPHEGKEAAMGANGHTLDHTRQDIVPPVDYGRPRASFLPVEGSYDNLTLPDGLPDVASFAYQLSGK